MDVNTYFFDLIKIALGRKKCLSGIPTENEWEDIYFLAKKQALIGIVFSAIDKLSKNELPPKSLLIKWFVESEAIRERNSQANVDAVKICNEIRKDGFHCIVLKGQGIATYYPDSKLRTSGDIDLWIKGDCKTILSYLHSKGKVISTTYMHADFEGIVDTKVEVHYKPSFFYNPFYLYRFNKFIDEQDDLFNNYIELPDGNGKIFVPTVEFNRYYILQHIFRHFLGEGVGLRQFLDYYFVLQTDSSEESKQNTMKLFKQTGMMEFVGATMWVLQKTFGMESKYLLCPPNYKGGKKLLDEIMMAGNFGKYDLRIDRKKHHKLLPRLLNSIKRKIRFIMGYPKELLFDIPMRTYMYIWKYFV